MIKILISIMMLGSVLLSADLEWPSDYEEALKQAKIQKKHVYMLITAQGCRWCRKFEATTLQDKSILELLNKKYILLHVDKDLDFFPKKFDSNRVPRHYFLTEKGEEIYSFLGYWNSEDFASFVGDVDSRYIKKFINKGEK